MPFDNEQYYRLMSMVYNLFYSRKRLARRLLRLKTELGKAQLAVRDLVVSEGAELLAGEISTGQVVRQTIQHPLRAAKAASALEAIFGDAVA